MSIIRVVSLAVVVIGAILFFWGQWLYQPINDPNKVLFALPDNRLASGLRIGGAILAVLGCWGLFRSTGVVESPVGRLISGWASIVIGVLILIRGIWIGAIVVEALANPGGGAGTIGALLIMPLIFSLLIGSALVFSGVQTLRRRRPAGHVGS